MGFTIQCVLKVGEELVSIQLVKSGYDAITSLKLNCLIEKAGKQLVRFNQDTRLNYRVLELRTSANQGIFEIQCQTENIFRQVLLSQGFRGIHTPKLIKGSSEGGSAVFWLDYNGRPACLAQSPQLHKQMAICSDFRRAFEIGPVFRAEHSFTYRHLCVFT